MSWVVRFFPIMLVLLVSNVLFLLRNVKKNEVIGNADEFFEKEFGKLPPMSFEEQASLILFLIATVLSFTRQLYQNLLPGLKPAYAFIICAILSFMITDKSGNRLMVWKSVQTKIIWELIYIFAGGLAAGTLINGSGVPYF